MEFKNDALNSRFVVPDAPTVRQQLRYKGELGMRMGAEIYERLWQAAKGLIGDWDSPHLNLDDDIDELTDPNAAMAIIWAGGQVLEFINGLEALPKNS